MIVIDNGLIVDGLRNKPYHGYLVLKGELISEIGVGMSPDEIKSCAELVIDAQGMIVSPGFIDIHTHSDICYIVDNYADSKVLQGVTTEIGGNCGISSIPFKKGDEIEMTKWLNNSLQVPMTSRNLYATDIIEFRNEQNNRIPVNLGMLIGHGMLRSGIIGFDAREATTKELDELCETLDYQLKNGALGISFGLIYPPGNFAPKEELLAIANIVKNNNAILAVHMRNEKDGVFDAVDEMLDIAKATGVHLHISHLKLMGKKQWGRAKELLNKIDNAIDDGYNITCDQYPFTATSTRLGALLPTWANDGGFEKAKARLMQEPNLELDEAISTEMESRGGPSAVTVANSKGHMKEVEGKTISNLSIEFGLNPVDTVKKILIQTDVSASAIYHSLSDSDIFEIIKKDYISIGSDGYAMRTDPDFTTTNPHPRNFGTFPEFLELVRENNLLSIEDAVYKMTKLSADILGLKDRGSLKKNNKADIVIFDYNIVNNNSTYLNSVSKPTGIYYSFVNGEIILDNSKPTSNRPGVVI